MKDYIIKGQFIDSQSPDTLRVVENGYLLVSDGKCAGLFRSLPERYAALPLTDFGDCLVLPGMCDLHVHAPQFGFRGLGMDLELLDWLNTYTFPEEAKFRDLAYAEKAYDGFVAALRRSVTTRASVFATIHSDATLLLMEKLERSGLRCFVGKVNMDRNSPDILREASVESALRDTEAWICDANERFSRTKPILTPRFIPSCSDELMQGLKGLQRKYGLPTQSHLSENFGEIAWVRELAPSSKHYGDAYDRFGMFGGDHPCIMAHCVHSGEEELALIKQNGVFIAHSPESNMNIASGVAPVSRYLALGLQVGLASDMAGGSSESMLRAMMHAIQASKLRWRLEDQSVKALSLEQAFYMATAGGGAFFGKVGRFAPGFEFDAVVLDDSRLVTPRPLGLQDRLERSVYLADDRDIAAKYVAGERLF
ncbi:MAG: amidohydrolase family protein [Oscillospiraceae bacterium]|nr:amidohydrolase family protein [Oscillospiraceae bacterium]